MNGYFWEFATALANDQEGRVSAMAAPGRNQTFRFRVPEKLFLPFVHDDAKWQHPTPTGHNRSIADMRDMFRAEMDGRVRHDLRDPSPGTFSLLV